MFIRYWNGCLETISLGESPSGKAPDFDSGIRRFDPYLPSQTNPKKRVIVYTLFLLLRGAHGL